MGGDINERLFWKEPLKSLETELQEEYGLTPIASRALVNRISGFIIEQFATGTTARGPGQIQYPAVAIGEPAGKPIRYCLRVNVRLTFLHPDDRDILRHSGAVEFRKHLKK
jgi:hypothetical protein